MNTYRNGDSIPVPPAEPENPLQNEPLLQHILQQIEPPSTPPTGVTYAQIQRHNAINNDALDFRLQTPRSDGSVLSDYRSISSNGYINVHPVNPAYQQQPSQNQLRNRPQSPETSF
jgi:hypothetical protein